MCTFTSMIKKIYYSLICQNNMCSYTESIIRANAADDCDDAL